MANIRILEVERKTTIVGRGDVWVIDLTKNNISTLRKEWEDEGIFIRGYVKERDDSDIYQISGIEAFATFEGYSHKTIGLLIKKQKTR